MCMRCQDVGIHSHNVLLNRSGLILQKKLENLLRTHKQINKQTENSKTEAALSPVVCGSSGNAGQQKTLSLLALVHQERVIMEYKILSASKRITDVFILE